MTKKEEIQKLVHEIRVLETETDPAIKVEPSQQLPVSVNSDIIDAIALKKRRLKELGVNYDELDW